MSSSKKSKDPLPPPPQIDLSKFDSKFLKTTGKSSSSPSTAKSESTKSNNVSFGTSSSTSGSSFATSGTIVSDIPPPPPPLPEKSKSALTNANTSGGSSKSDKLNNEQKDHSLQPSQQSGTLNDDQTKTLPQPESMNQTKKSEKYPSAAPPLMKPPPPKQQQKKKILPPLTHLASRQSTFPVLIVSTQNSQQKIAMEKNNLTLSALFNGIARTIAPPNNLPSSNIAPRLPPFRSINRSMMLSWNQIHVRFLDSDGLEVVHPGDTDRELNFACGSSAYTNVKDIGQSLEQANVISSEVSPSTDELEAMLKKYIIEASSSSKNTNNATDNSYDYNGDTHIDDNKFSRKKKDPSEIEACLPTESWLRTVRQLLDTATDNLQQDMHSCPIISLLIASTDDCGFDVNSSSNQNVDFISCFQELRSIHHLPRPYQSGHYDPHGTKHVYLLLHDNKDGPQNFEENLALTLMRKAFPNQICAVLRINSVGEPADENNNIITTQKCSPETAHLWDPELSSNDTFPTKRGIIDPNLPTGLSLTHTDLQNIRRLIASLVSDGILPAMERRIFNLNVTVNNAKRGVKNMFNKFLRKPRDGSSGQSFDSFSNQLNGFVGGGANGGKLGNISSNSSVSSEIIGGGIIKYTHDQIESQVRLLADSLFIMRDYEAALSVYRLARDDFKADRATVHYGSTHEMMALCLHSLDPLGTRNNRDLHSALETALYSYTRAAEEERFLLQQQQNTGGAGSINIPGKVGSVASLGFCNKLATRLCLVLCSIPALYQSRHLETADLLASSGSHETPLCAAILLEQSARHYKLGGMNKKYAFHMLMAAHMYRTAKVEKHSMRCFAISHTVYGKSEWRELYSHLESSLAQQLFTLGRNEAAILMYCKLVGYRGFGVGRNQQKFVQHILEIVRKHPTAAFDATKNLRLGDDDMSDGDGSISPSPLGSDHLEIPDIELPLIQDDFIQIFSEQQCRHLFHEKSNDVDGDKDNANYNLLGHESEWQKLSSSIEADLRAEKKRRLIKADGTVEIMEVDKEKMVNDVIEEIDKENFMMASSTKKSTSASMNVPTIRPRKEPILVRFYVTNTLDIRLQLTDLQLVASLQSEASSDDGYCGTNKYNPSCRNNDKIGKTFQFRCTHRTFTSPDFLYYKKAGENEEEVHSNENDPDNPYFVVEKKNLSLEPREVKRVTIAICPLVQGHLAIHGIRWKVLNEFWASHKFKIKGPLLQDTALNRACRGKKNFFVPGTGFSIKSVSPHLLTIHFVNTCILARGTPHLLESVISHDMPDLSIDVLNTKSSMLQGEIAVWNLRITNIGTAPATNIVMKTNLPWVALISDKQTQNYDGDAKYKSRGNCVGPTGTLSRLTLRTNAEKEDSTTTITTDVINPGETVTVPIRVRVSGNGSSNHKHKLYLLFRYEVLTSSLSESQVSGSNNFIKKYTKRKHELHRHVRKIIPVLILPSLSLSASLMPSYWDKNEHILSVDVSLFCI